MTQERNREAEHETDGENALTVTRSAKDFLTGCIGDEIYDAVDRKVATLR